jgi:hypothetical protein
VGTTPFANPWQNPAPNIKTRPIAPLGLLRVRRIPLTAQDDRKKRNKLR